MKEIKIKDSDEIIYSFKTSSKLPVYMWVNEKKENTYLALGVKYGSIHTKFKCNNIQYTVPTGIAHYLEHIKFHLKDCDASDLFTDLGCDSNAYTSHEETVFEVYANSNIYDACKLLLDFVYDDYFNKEIVENERGIILEEANSKKDNPKYEFYRKYLENFYINSNYKKPIIGTVEDIKKITLDDIKLIHNYFYRPENMFMVITGNFDPKEMEKIICKNEKDRKFKDIGPVKIINENEPEKLNVTTYEHKAKNCENISSKVSIKTHLKKFKGLKKEKVVIAIKCMLMSQFGYSSDFYEFLMQQNYVTSFYTSVNEEDDIVAIDFSYQSDEPDKVFDLIKNKLNDAMINEEDLNRIRNYSYAQFIMKFDNIYSVANSIIISLVENNDPDNKSITILNKLSIDDINSIFKLVNKKNIIYGTLKPFKNKKKEVK